MTVSPQSQEPTVLAADIGGTKTLVALVRGRDIIASRKIPTERSSTPDVWIASVLEIAQEWSGAYRAAAITVTGQVHAGLWKGVNHDTLRVSEFDLAAAISKFGVPYEILNDAQAAAWGEHIYGSVPGSDLVYLTVSTGLGGGIVAGGKLLRGHRGLAGHFGLFSQDLLSGDNNPQPFENAATGPWIARAGSEASKNPQTAKSVFEQARTGEEWARRIVEMSASRVASLCRDISFAIDPPIIVIGGGVGLADGYVDSVRRHFAEQMPGQKPEILISELQEHAGIVGVAAFAAQTHLKNGGE